VFAEPGYETKVMAAVIEGTNAKTGNIDPEGLMIARGADAYDALMRGLAKGLQSCLAPTS
jgi:zinc transport system substrate-binding protein